MSRLGSRLVLGSVALASVAAAAGSSFRLAPPLKGPDAIAQFELEEPAAWAVEDGTLLLKAAGKPGGPIRKPSRWAILKGPDLGDLSLRARVRCDAGVERKGRDVLLFVGYQSPTRFYYVHLSNETTYPHNGVFLVNDADRKRLDEQVGEPKLLDRDWHEVRLVRDVERGSIEVYLDGSAKPVLSAQDKTLLAGRVGFGSFDDTAAFKDVLVEGERAPTR